MSPFGSCSHWFEWKWIKGEESSFLINEENTYAAKMDERMREY